MIDRRAFSVGGHVFLLEYQEGTLSESDLAPYAPFQVVSNTGEDVLFTLTLTDDAESLSAVGEPSVQIKDEHGSISIFTLDDGGMIVILTAGSDCGECRVRISGDYRQAEACISGTQGERRYAIDSALMLLFTLSTAGLDTILLHASVIEYAGRGYLFLGKSGTGKSTHARLWLENVEGSELLNDDNPVVRIEAGTVFVYGSPWSGKTECYVGRRVPVGGIVRLSQADCNIIAPLSGVHAYAALLPSCSCMRWNHEMAAGVHATMSRIISSVPCFALECRPEREAAEVCFNKLVGGNG